MKDNTNTNETRRLYWVETQIKNGDIFQDGFTFSEEQARINLEAEIAHTTASELKNREIFAAFADYSGTETDPEKAYHALIDETGCLDFDILGPTKAQFEAAVSLMDDELREEVHVIFSPCSNFFFLEKYCERHFEKYGEEFSY